MTIYSSPAVSVIVAVHNQERYIGRCLRSLLHQSLPHQQYEIIVVNDGSDDRTPFALSLFTDDTGSPISVLNNKLQLGLPASLNKGIAASNAKYIVRVDSDDFVNSNFLNFLFFYLETNQHFDAVACDYYLVDNLENVTRRANCFEEPIACGIMFRRDHLLSIGCYDESFLCHEEQELRIRFEKKYRIAHLDIPLYRYRRHETNMTNDSSKMNSHYQKLVAKHGLKALN